MRHCLALAALLGLIAPLAHPAQKPDTVTPTLVNYVHTAWNGQRGAPADVVQFTQTPDGWLWISSPNGLFRFDGVAFERMDSVWGHRLHSTNTLALLTTRDGRLWVGGRFGGISMVAEDRMRVFGEPEGLPRGSVMTMAEGPDGSVWASTSHGLAVLAPGAAQFRRLGAAEGLPETGARQVLFGRDGRQWVVIKGGIYFRDSGQGRFRRAWPQVELLAMTEAPDGTLWGSDGIDKQYRVLPAAPPGNPAPRAELDGNGALFDRDGNMWILKINAVERRRAPYVGRAADARQLGRESGMSGAMPQAAFQDREGNLWIGTAAGLDRLREVRIAALPSDPAFDHPLVVPDQDGRVIISDWRHPLRRYDTSGAKDALPGLDYKAAYRAPDGSLWLASETERWQRSSAGVIKRMPHPPQVSGFAPQAMTFDARGRMWISISGKGLFLIEDGNWRKHGGLPGLPEGLALTLTTDRAGRVWAAYQANQIALIDGERVRMFGKTDGLTLGNVQSLLVDGGTLWAGGEHGLAWYDGRRWQSVIPAGAQPLRGISGIVRTPAGELWLHGSDGISRIGAAEVARLWRDPAAVLSYERFDALDGLVGSAEQLRPLPSITQGSDGRLWFTTASDVASIDPGAIARNPLAPPVQVLSLQSGGVSYPASRGLLLPTGQRDLRIAYTALALAVPERVRFRYRLEGFDNQWQDAGTRREAVYTNLPPGAYVFRVIAANEDGVWNDTGATLEVNLPPRFIETDWFVVLMVLLAVALLAGLYALRVRRLTARLHERMEARLGERERIARGLHDTLLQSVQGLIMLFDRQVRSLPIGPAQRANIEQTLNLADALLAEGRDCILDLHRSAEAGDLERSLCQYGGALLQQRFTCSIHGTARTLSPQVREEVQAIAREALFNAARHADAARVELIIDYRPDGFALTVRDDGCGMPAAMAEGSGRPSHYGIVGMRERARSMGARCSLVSAPGRGTSMQLEIPAERAYPGQRSAALFAQLRRRPRPDAGADAA